MLDVEVQLKFSSVFETAVVPLLRHSTADLSPLVSSVRAVRAYVRQ